MLLSTRSRRIHRFWVMLVLLCLLVRVARPALSLQAEIAEASFAHLHLAFTDVPTHCAAAIALFLDGVIASPAALPSSAIQPVRRGTSTTPSYGFLGSSARELSQLRI